jgi:uncharacterized protein YjbJ (UPF0337 family)
LLPNTAIKRRREGNPADSGAFSSQPQFNGHKENEMVDKERIAGSAQQAKGSMKVGAGKLMGDRKVEAEGHADKAGGKLRNFVGGVKDALRRK